MTLELITTPHRSYGLRRLGPDRWQVTSNARITPMEFRSRYDAVAWIGTRAGLLRSAPAGAVPAPRGAGRRQSRPVASAA